MLISTNHPVDEDIKQDVETIMEVGMYHYLYVKVEGRVSRTEDFEKFCRLPKSGRDQVILEMLQQAREVHDEKMRRYATFSRTVV